MFLPVCAPSWLWKFILHIVFACFGLCWCNAFFHLDFRKARFWWLVLVCVWGCVFLWWGAFLHVLPPWFWQGFLGNACCWCVRFFVSCMVGSPWGIPIEIFTCQTPCGICMDSIGGGHGVQARNFSKHVPPQIFHAKPASKRMKILPFYGLGVGVYELVWFRQAPCIIICLLKKKLSLSKSCLESVELQKTPLTIFPLK